MDNYFKGFADKISNFPSSLYDKKSLLLIPLACALSTLPVFGDALRVNNTSSNEKKIEEIVNEQSITAGLDNITNQENSANLIDKYNYILEREVLSLTLNKDEKKEYKLIIEGGGILNLTPSSLTVSQDTVVKMVLEVENSPVQYHGIHIRATNGQLTIDTRGAQKEGNIFQITKGNPNNYRLELKGHGEMTFTRTVRHQDYDYVLSNVYEGMDKNTVIKTANFHDITISNTTDVKLKKIARSSHEFLLQRYDKSSKKISIKKIPIFYKYIKKNEDIETIINDLAKVRFRLGTEFILAAPGVNNVIKGNDQNIVDLSNIYGDDIEDVIDIFRQSPHKKIRETGDSQIDAIKGSRKYLKRNHIHDSFPLYTVSIAGQRLIQATYVKEAYFLQKLKEFHYHQKITQEDLEHINSYSVSELELMTSYNYFLNSNDLRKQKTFLNDLLSDSSQFTMLVGINSSFFLKTIKEAMINSLDYPRLNATDTLVMEQTILKNVKYKDYVVLDFGKNTYSIVSNNNQGPHDAGQGDGISNSGEKRYLEFAAKNPILTEINERRLLRKH